MSEEASHLFSRIIKASALGVLVFFGLFVFAFLVDPSQFQPAKKSDFRQDYLAAKAIIAGDDPYLPMDQLGAKYGVNIPLPDVPTPHPPAFEILITPLGWLPYQTAAVVWFLLSLACLVLSLKLLLDLRPVNLFIAMLIAVIWYPIQADLASGQVMCSILALLCLAFTYLKKNRPIVSGVFLGLALAVKLIVWPLLVFLIIRRQFRAATSTLLVNLGINCLAVSVIGLTTVKYYYQHLGGRIAKIYQADSFNFSVFNLGPRMVSGTKGELSRVMQTDPFFYAPQYAQMISVFLVLVILAAAFYLAFRAEFYRGFAALVAISIIVSPTTWWYYSVLMLLPMKLLLEMDTAAKFLLAACVVAPYIPLIVAPVFGTAHLTFAGLLLLTPLVSATLAAIWLLKSSYGQHRLGEGATDVVPQWR